jgi:hypothetical protein
MELDPHTLEESEEMPVFMDSVFALTAAEGMISLVATSKRKGEYMASRRGSVPATRAGLKTLRAFLEEHVCNPRCLDSRIKYIGNWGLRCAQKSTEDSDVSTPSNGSE